MRKPVPGFAVLLAAAAVSCSMVTGGTLGLSAALAASSEAANPNLPAQTSSARGVTHREGVLRFKPISPRPQSIELQITRAGEDAPRSFRWQLK